MNYLGRPIFEFPINWADPVNKAFQYELREELVGFGAEFFSPTQLHTVQGYGISVDCYTPADIKALDDFTAALTGRLVGFWLPAPFDAFGPVANIVSVNVFDVPAQGLADTLADHPDVYIWFTADGEAPVAARITSVVDQGNGLERVSINPGCFFLAQDPQIRRLHYVRLVDDLERGRFEAEGWQKRSLRVIELPTEYAALETGLKPIYLYHFWFGAPMDVHWYFTSYAADVIWKNLTWTAGPVNHGALRREVKFEPETLEIKVGYDADHPVSLLTAGVPPGRPLNVEVFCASYEEIAQPTITLLGPAVAIPDSPPAVPYPSTILVSGEFTFTRLTVSLFGVFHGETSELDVLLVSPAGKKILLMSDAGGSLEEPVDLVFDDAAASSLPASPDSLESGTFKPTNYDTITDAFSAPAPAGPYLTNLASVIADAPAGTWSLYVRDDTGSGAGGITGGWALNFHGPVQSTARLFTGQVRKVTDRGETLVAHCDSFLGLLNRRTPRMLFQKECNNQVYEARTCKAPRAAFEEQGYLSVIDNTGTLPKITVQLDNPTVENGADDWFAEGWIETGQQENYEVRTILASEEDPLDATRVILTLNAPLLRAVPPLQRLYLVPGCDGQRETCITKFDNFKNFGGFPSIPEKNLSLVAANNTATQGDKK